MPNLTPNAPYTANSGITNTTPFIIQFNARNPTPQDVNYSIQQPWINTLTDEYWTLESFSSAGGHLTAVWSKNGSGILTVEALKGNTGGAVNPDSNHIINTIGATPYTVTGSPSTNTLTWSDNGTIAYQYTTDSGTAVPSANNLNVFGTPNAITTSGSGSTITINSIYWSLTPYIVGPDIHSQFSTIASAYAAAVAAGAPANIYIKPGTYTENLTLTAGINLIGFGQQATIIKGKLTFTDADEVSIQGLTLQTNSDYFLAVTGSSASVINMFNCYLNCLNNTGIDFTSSSSSSQINIFDCEGNLATTGIGLYTMSSAGVLSIQNSFIDNSGLSSTASSNSAGSVQVDLSHIRYLTGTSSTGDFSAYQTYFDVNNNIVLASAGTGFSQLSQCFIFSGTATALTGGAGNKINAYGCTFQSSNAHVVTGAGSFVFAGLVFNTEATITTTTQIPGTFFPGSYQIQTISASPYTVLNSDTFLLVDSTNIAITLNFPNTPPEGAYWVIKDNGNAALHNITITTPGGTTTFDGATSKTISTNYGSLSIFSDGTNYFIQSKV